MLDVNFLAIVLAALSGFIIGGLWYSKLLFGMAWMSAAGVTEEDVQNGHPGKVYGIALVLSILASWMFAWMLHPQSLHSGLLYGLHIGVFFIATTFGISYLFEGRSMKLWLINAGYHIVQFSVIGLILGAFG